MMRPQRAFTMPRITPRDSRNTARRLVAITSSHSSSFTRNARLSRAIPALLTRRATSSISFSSASQAASSRTSRTFPVPGTFLAPALVVAVPNTLAPCFASSAAMAWPMPREAPVTRATFPSSMTDLLERLLERGALGKRERRQILRDAFRQPGEHLAGSAFDDMRRAHGHHRLNRLDPAHGRSRLAHEGVFDFHGIGLRLYIDIIDERDPGRGERGFFEKNLQPVSGRFHQRGVKRRAHRQWHGAFGAARLAYLDGPRHGLRFAGDHHLPRRIEIHRLHFAPRLGASRLRRLVVEAEDRRH